MGLDPGIRTGVKVAVVSDTGKVLATATVYPHEPRRDWDGALHSAGQAGAPARREPDRHRQRHGQPRDRPAGRRADQALQRKAPGLAGEGGGQRGGRLGLLGQRVRQPGAARLDVSLRGAVSIARRLQDPLAELVKIDPKSIGVGQYQHDVNQSELARTLDAVVEDCVNGVGVDLNTASPCRCWRGCRACRRAVAAAIVRWRDGRAPSANRRQLLDVTGLGPKTFELSAGFLRIRDGDNPLDATGVHPETYPVVQRMLGR
jgi:uncharacterized protein